MAASMAVQTAVHWAVSKAELTVGEMAASWAAQMAG